VLFTSGAAALIYQLLWIKQLSLVVGVDVYAVTIAVSAFFAGLAAGGLFVWPARRSDEPAAAALRIPRVGSGHLRDLDNGGTHEGRAAVRAP
jgi:hypothetical protein